MQVSKLGIALSFGFVLSQAIRDVHLGHLFGTLDLFEAALLAFGTAALVFGASLALFRPDQISHLVANWKNVLILNITTTVARIAYFGSLRLVEPAAANLAFAGIAPIAVAVFARCGLTSAGEKVTGPFEKIMHVALFGIVCMLALIVSTGFSGFANIDAMIGLVGVGLACLAGLSITAETIFAKKMNYVGVSPLANRAIVRAATGEAA